MNEYNLFLGLGTGLILGDNGTSVITLMGMAILIPSFISILIEEKGGLK